MSNSETKETMENSLQITSNGLDGIIKVGDPFWNTPVDFKITTFDMPVYQDHIYSWAEYLEERIYGN